MTDAFPILTFGRGACIATDAIARGRARVAFMYRDEPDSSMDSGWRFFDTAEPALARSAANVYDLSLIASIDPAVSEHLGAPTGAAFRREGDGFAAVPFKLS